ncbi:class I SAM-dependent methyltransferase [Fusibacter paucivorans]|uniref:Class I SAM-dependent methyltransferase n=1 Tax=Fusibacter paucivorans TaxID=76009 RepID=A0ABS5PR79_9FIRM|nr:class I SAM-dependent methyltransferase [Fusibacter paucivorans]MBS7527392.1 class I SAM-dependent methyltransferase [Fusibacter paucivorans]
MSTLQHHRVWNQAAYDAWLNKYGEPEVYASKLAQKPLKALGTLIPHFGDIHGKKILNLMGSNGAKALCLALLGADVTVVDFSEANRQYAEAMCKSQNVAIHYIVSDVCAYDDVSASQSYDIVFAEMGILHYFTDLSDFLQIPMRYLKPGGHFIIRDFHPVSTKLIVSRGSTAKIRKHKVEGDYFSSELTAQPSALSKYKTSDSRQADTNPDDDQTVWLRHWTLGEIVTAAAKSGLWIQQLIEEPNLSSEQFDRGIPKTFILTANKPSQSSERI